MALTRAIGKHRGQRGRGTVRAGGATAAPTANAAPSSTFGPGRSWSHANGVATTQAALGRALLDLARVAPEAAARVVTVSPSTNLGGWVPDAALGVAQFGQSGAIDDLYRSPGWTFVQAASRAAAVCRPARRTR